MSPDAVSPAREESVATETTVVPSPSSSIATPEVLATTPCARVLPLPRNERPTPSTPATRKRDSTLSLTLSTGSEECPLWKAMLPLLVAKSSVTTLRRHRRRRTAVPSESLRMRATWTSFAPRTATPS